MSPCKLDLDLYEDNLLDSCWRVGACRSRTAGFSSFDRTEIAAVDIVACCKRITSIIEKKSSQLQRSNSVATRSRHQLSHNFKDIARLTCGVTDIYRCQVDILLGDTKDLLDQMKGFNLVLTTRKSVIRINRKRKSVITKESKVTISKHPRLEAPELLNESVQQYYENMLSECQVWQSESTQQVDLQESIELPRNCNQLSAYHAVTITEEFEIHQDPSAIDPSDGFGECDVMDLNFFHELYPSRNKQRETPKRRSTIDDLTDILPAKMPRFDDNTVELNISQADSAIMTTNFPAEAENSIDPANVTYIVCEPSLPLDLSNPPSRKMSRADSALMSTHSTEDGMNVSGTDSAIMTTTYTHSTEDGRNISGTDSAIMTTTYTHSTEDGRNMSGTDSAIMTTTYTHSIESVAISARNPRKKKLKIDKCIEYSREKLLKDRYQYLMRAEAIPPPSKRRTIPEDVLSKLGNSLIFPEIMRNYSIHLSKEEKEVQSEVTLRSIFGEEFTEALVKEIIVQSNERKNKGKRIVTQPVVVPEEPEDVIITPPSPPFVEINNNYNADYEDNIFDSHSVMMNLLKIWRNNPEIEGIDANQFIKSFPDRPKAALAFNFLLYLVRDNFIKISKKPDSIEMEAIFLGNESNSLIENLIKGEMS